MRRSALRAPSRASSARLTARLTARLAARLAARLPARRAAAPSVAVLALAVLVTGCDLVGVDVDVEGRYALQTVNGAQVPTTVQTNELPDGTEWSFRVLSGSLDLDAGRYTLSIVSEGYEDGVLVHTGQETWTGSYTTRRNQLTLMADATGASGTGRVDGADVRITIATLELGQMTLVFRRT